MTPTAGPPWPASAVFRPRGLEIGGLTAEDLANAHGTPLFVVDADDVRARCRMFASAFPRALYAVKAFTARRLLQAACEEGLGLLVSTGGELVACLGAGADPARIAMHGNNKSEAEIELAVRSGVGLISIDHFAEVARVEAAAAAAGVRQDVLVRVIPGVTGARTRSSRPASRTRSAPPIPGAKPGRRSRGSRRQRGLPQPARTSA